MKPRIVRLAVALACTVVAAPARATWSIVAADPKTGEVAVGIATCINGSDLEKLCPVIRVGYGGAAHQSVVDATGIFRKITWDQLALGTPPEQILQLIDAVDNKFQQRQIGIVDLGQQAVSFTGNQCAQWAGGVTGALGSIRFAIQGNILTGELVVAAAEAAFLAAEGDLADRLMAAMEAARSMGGDGRCSCSPAAPTSCGSPPPMFEKSAHIGCMIIARIGDVDGICTANQGCVNGSYFMNLNVKGNQSGQPDPVFQLASQFQAWRASWIGRPDHVRSEAWLDEKVLSADGEATATLHVRLRDWQGTALLHGGAAVAAALEPGGAGALAFGAATDHGDGTYTIPVAVAPGTFGSDRVRVTADDGQGPVVLYPFVEVAIAKTAALAGSTAVLSASAGGNLDLALDAGSALAGRSYLVLCSAGSAAPGFDVGTVHVPLALDAALLWSAATCNVAPLIQTCGVLDQNGRAAASVRLGAEHLHGFAPAALAFSFVTTDPLDYAAAPLLVGIIP